MTGNVIYQTVLNFSTNFLKNLSRLRFQTQNTEGLTIFSGFFFLFLYTAHFWGFLWKPNLLSVLFSLHLSIVGLLKKKVMMHMERFNIIVLFFVQSKMYNIFCIDLGKRRFKKKIFYTPRMNGCTSRYITPLSTTW